MSDLHKTKYTQQFSQSNFTYGSLHSSFFPWAAFPFPFGHLSTGKNITMTNRALEKANGRNVVRKKKNAENNSTPREGK